MAARRYRYGAGKRRNRKRKKRKPLPPRSGWTLRELAALTQVAPRTIGDYVRRGLLTGPEFHGRATRYQREHILRLLAIKAAKAEGAAGLTAVKLRLETMGTAQLETWLLGRGLQPAVAKALNVGAAVATPANAGGLPAQVEPEMWQRIVLLPGLELSKRSGAGPLATDVANALFKHFESMVRQGLSAATPASTDEVK